MRVLDWIALGIMLSILLAIIILAYFILKQRPQIIPPQRVIIHQKGITDSHGMVIHLKDKHGSGVDLNFGHEERR